jgi:membrane protein DedA with SNARE-associated domain/membrane-associated phospholipid phosphatase
MENLLQPLLDWVALHPHAAGIAVFVIALMESLIVLGLLIPGAVLLFGAGALMATGALPVVPTMLWTIAGAICGDLISFLLGHHYHQQLRVIWPFRRYPALVNRGVDFFCKHGGKSIFMARFIGPLRPVVPAIAGMMNMTLLRFLLVDIVASVLWAPAYILPGMVFGASLGLAAEVAGRLVVLLVTVVGLSLLSVWLIHSLVRMLHPHASTLIERILNWSRNHPRIQPLAGSLLDPDHPEARGLAVLSGLFFITLWLLLLIVSQVYSGHFLHGIDQYVLHAMENLRTPWADQVMVFMTQLAGTGFLAIVLAASCAWLFLKGYPRAAWHWLGVYVCAGLLTWTLKHTAQVERPLSFHEGYSFPSAHTSMSFVVYGFLALIVARELHYRHRWLPYSVAALLAGTIALSRLYLGVHWFSDVLAGATLGIFWVALIGIAYDRHPAPVLPVKRLLAVVLVVMGLTGFWQMEQRFSDELAHYAPRIQIHKVSMKRWQNSGWQTLPTWRVDLEGSNEQPMNFQWAGPLETLQTVLQEKGWHAAPAIGPSSTMNWMAPQPDIHALPILPQVHDGQHQELLLLAPDSGGMDHIMVLRLWPSGMQLEESRQTVRVGNVTWLHIEHDLPLVAFLSTAADFETPLRLLRETLAESDRIQLLQHSRRLTGSQTEWQGQVLLAWEP